MFPVFGGSTRSDPVRNAMLSETHIFSPRTLNEVRLGYNRRRTDTLQQNQGHDYAAELGLPMLSKNPADFAYPGFNIPPYANLGDGGNNPRYRLDEAIQLIDNVTLIRGLHTYKFGIEIRRVHLYNSVGQFPRGTYRFASNIFARDALANFLLGLPSDTLISQPAINNYSQYTGWDAYVQDDWKASRKLTLNLGIRYTYNQPWTEKYNRDSSFDPSTGKLITLGQGGYPRGLYYPYKRNFAPRVGFAYRPFNGSTVLRAGYGIFRAIQPGNPAFNQGQNPPFGSFGLQFFSNPNDPTALTLANPFPGAGTPNVAQFPQLFVLPLNNKDAYSQQWEFNIQREFTKSALVQVAYVGSTGTHLLIRQDINQPQAGPGPIQPRRPYPDFGRIYADAGQGSSNYHAFQAKVEKRFSSDLAFLAAYTLSKSIDNQTSINVRPQDSWNLRGERGFSEFDSRHRLVASYIYELPFGRGKKYVSSAPAVLDKLLAGWKMAGLFTFNTGNASTPILTFDNPNVGAEVNVARPDRIANGNLSSGRTLSRYWDASAFRVPAQYAFGNAGRNILIGPSKSNWDFSAIKETRTTESQVMEFRAEFFNFLNHPNFGQPGNQFPSPTFGVITSAAAPRIIQFGLKYVF